MLYKSFHKCTDGFTLTKLKYNNITKYNVICFYIDWYKILIFYIHCTTTVCVFMFVMYISSGG